MWPEIIIAISFTALGIACSYYFYQRGVKEGADRFLKLLLQSGYDSKVAAFREQNLHVAPGGIVFLGDSITQDYPVQDYFYGMNAINRGIGGDTTSGVLKRLEESVFQLNPHQVVLLIGTNDFALTDLSCEAIYQAILAIVQTIQNRLPETRFIVESVYPVNHTIDPFSVSKRNNQDIAKLNELLSILPGVKFVDLTATLADSEGNLMREFTHDGLHVNQNAYRLITEKLKPYLTE